MNRFLIYSMLLVTACSGKNRTEMTNDRIEHIAAFASEFVAARNVDVWLPSGYDTTLKYPVIYMHDGQMLFDSTTTWNKQEWMVDEVLSRLISAREISPCIVVGISNNGEYRHTEYFPQKPLASISEEMRNSIVSTYLKGEPLADRYLKLIVYELKPYIDLNYSTLTDRDNTFIMGSSMGGLISLYAICEYPEVFGGAGCLSTHWPMVGVDASTNTADGEVEKAFRDYLTQNLPSPAGHKIYFDYGTETLDALYEPHQLLIDQIMTDKGFSPSNWITVKFQGDDHSERSWSRRLHVPVKFLLALTK